MSLAVNTRIDYTCLNRSDVRMEEKKLSLFSRIKEGLSKTRESIAGGVEQVFAAFRTVDEELFEELEEALIMADMGVETTMAVLEKLRTRVKSENVKEGEIVKKMLAEEISNTLTAETAPFELSAPAVLLIIGVNGAGKTTTIGKLTNWYKNEGKSVLVAAADTFRAAAIDQLAVWCERAGVTMIRQAENSDPAAVVFDAAASAKARGIDLLIVDTAGRLHNKKNLMEELKKINRIISAQFPEAQREVMLVLDATTGQNALQQAKLFKEAADITGIILTKLDGTTKGGIVVSIKNELDIPVRFVTLGEQIEDLQPFDADMFAKALFEA
jgi:fused signal recognition particle receptor